jgi:hypothetical protein
MQLPFNAGINGIEIWVTRSGLGSQAGWQGITCAQGHHQNANGPRRQQFQRWVCWQLHLRSEVIRYSTTSKIVLELTAIRTEIRASNLGPALKDWEVASYLLCQLGSASGIFSVIRLQDLAGSKLKVRTKTRCTGMFMDGRGKWMAEKNIPIV